WGHDRTLIKVLAGHTSLVIGAIELGDGRLLSWSDDSTLRLWSHEGTPIMVSAGHTSLVIGAIELRDGRLLSW
ncbi:MAG TPA: hypothetical protein PLZ51_13380, partial [Aggregatilineales bacterium]|nr:hypothetical protein [Aggregatilineales bacterium]